MTETPERPPIISGSMSLDKDYEEWRDRWYAYHRLAVEHLLTILDESQRVEELAAGLKELRERFDAEESLNYFKVRWWTTEKGELKFRSTRSNEQTKTVYRDDDSERWVLKRAGTETNEDVAKALVYECLQWADLHHVGLAKALFSEGFIPPDGSD